MKKKLLLLAFLISQYFTFAQIEDAWVYLTDKANVQSALNAPITILTQRAIDRKNAHGVVIDERDVPVNESYISSLKMQNGITVMAKSKWFNAVHVRGTQTDINALSSLNFVASIDFADKNLNVGRSSKSKDKTNVEESQVSFVYGSTQNQVEMINADGLHLQDYTGSGMLVAVIDASFTNVNTMDAFQDLRNDGRLLGGYDFVDGTSDVYAFSPPSNAISHGTMVLSTMAGFIPDQYVGTAPDASYYLFRTEDIYNENPVEESYWVEAAERADSLGVDVVNTSLGYFDYSESNSNYSYTASDMDGNTAYITKGANIAFEKGMLLVNSAGNEGSNGIIAPADAAGVLTIGAVDASGTIAWFSSRGSVYQTTQKPDVVAQGQGAAVVNRFGSIAAYNGTSFSSPIMAGGVTCLWQALPTATNAEIMDYVRQSADRFTTPDYDYGYGIPNLGLALTIGLSVQEEKITALKLYPNPVSQTLYLKIPNNTEESTLTIYDVFGKVVIQKFKMNSSDSVDVSFMASGLYLVSFQSKELSKTFKLIKS